MKLTFLMGFKGVFHVVISHSVNCARASAGDGSLLWIHRFEFNVYTVIEKTSDNLERTMQYVYKCMQLVCVTGFCTEFHTLETGNENALTAKSSTIINILELLLIKLPVK